MPVASKKLDELRPSLASIKEEAAVLINKFDIFATISWKDYDGILQRCRDLLELLKLMNLPVVKPRWADFTDGGPGVGVNNHEVSFRDAELARLYSSDYRIRVHRAAGDSGQNEAERTNSAIGDAVVDGSTINWEHYKRFDGLSENDISSLSLEEYEKMEEERMQKNAWKVAHEVAARIDDAPVHSEYIKCLVAEGPDDWLFINQGHLKEYFSSNSNERKMAVPGAAYIRKIINFRDTHYERGELYFEYLKGDCSRTSSNNQSCSHCKDSEWVGPEMSRIPRPWPDESRMPEHHYRDVFSSPIVDDTGKPRASDDWQPRHQIKQMFESGTLKPDDEDAITNFSAKFIVERKLVKDYLQHLTTLERTKSMRSKDREKEREKRKQKSFNEYDWDTLCRTGKVQKLKVDELQKYLRHFNLSLKGKKNDKVRRVIAHVCSKSGETLDSFAIPQNQLSSESSSDTASSSSEDSDVESDSDHDVVIAHYSSSDLSESDASDPEENNHINIPVRETRSGRNVKTSFSQYGDCFVYY